MIFKYSLLCLLKAYFIIGTVALESIVGGDKARAHQFPYQVSLQNNGNHECGGGIIGDHFILTAAHCMMKSNRELFIGYWTVVAGTNNLNNTDKSAVKVAVKNVLVPLGFSFELHIPQNDIAVVELEESLNLTHHEHLKRLELPENKDINFVGTIAKIAGFGWNWAEVLMNGKKKQLIGGNNKTQLHFAEADVLSNSECQHGFKKHKVLEEHVCARIKHLNESKSYGSCIGDSGGALVQNNTVIGILSLGPTICSEKDKATIYTRVSHYLDFIKNSVDGREIHDIHTYDQNPLSHS